MGQLSKELQNRLKARLGEQIKFSYPIAKHTYFRAGGKAEAFVQAKALDDLAWLLKLCKEEGIKVTFLGQGANCLVSDQGVAGITISLVPGLSKVSVINDRLIVQAGASLARVAAIAAKHSLSGLEQLCGIPGTVGGTVRMNAGAYEKETSELISKVTFLNSAGELKTLCNSELQFSYRHSLFSEQTDWLIVEAEYQLQKVATKQQEVIYRTMAEVQFLRRSKQPLEYASGGSAFKRPPGYFAGKLITDAGLKGYRLGNAGVSDKHAGFIINYGGATATEIRQVFEHVRVEVKKQFNVLLEPEVRFIGEW